MNYIFLKKLLLYFSFIIFHLAAMEQKKEIQSLESFVFSFNNLSDSFKTLPAELKYHCVKYIMKDKQLWYPMNFSIQKEGHINSTHFSHDFSKIFYYVSNLGTWKNERFFKVLNINSGDDGIIPITIPEDSEKIISNNSNTQYAIISASITNTNRIDIVDGKTKSILTSLSSNKNINSLQWNKDNTYIMDNNATIWNIRTGKETTLLPLDYKSTDAIWNNDNSLIASYNSCADLDIWNVETNTLFRKLSGFVNNFKYICWNKDNIRIAFSNKKKNKTRSIYIYNVKTGECLFELPLDIELGIQHACFWKNNSEIFIYQNYKIMVVNTITQKLLSTIYDMRSSFGKIKELCFDNKGIYFFYIKDKGFLGRKGFLWKQYTDFTLDQIFLYLLLHKWILIKKLKEDISSIEQLLDDIVFYLPLNKSALLTIWNSFPEMVRKSLWKHKIRYFISG